MDIPNWNIGFIHLTRELPPPDPHSLCPLSSTEFVEPPEKSWCKRPHPLKKIPGYTTAWRRWEYVVSYLEHMKGRKHLGKTKIDGRKLLYGILTVLRSVFNQLKDVQQMLKSAVSSFYCAQEVTPTCFRFQMPSSGGYIIRS
jgi:hypothetical protein